MTPPRFPVSVKGVVLGDGGRVALLLNERDEWELPGGRLERDETPEACLVREIEEEMGVAATPGPLLDVWLYRVEPNVPDSEVLIVTYGCRTGAFEAVRWSVEHRAATLATRDEMERLRMPEGYRRAIRAWMSASR